MPTSKRPSPTMEQQRMVQQLFCQLERLRQDWLLTQEQLATLIELSPETLAVLQATPTEIFSLMLHHKVIARMEDLFRIDLLLDVLFSERENACAWIQKPNSASLFNGQTALHYMLQEPRYRRAKVIGYLVGACSGNFS